MKIFEGYQKGINLGGWLSQNDSFEKEHFETFITENDIKEIASWGLDHVRVPVDYVILEEENGTPKEEGFAYVTNCISWCKKYGLHMILDLHKTYGYTFDPLDDGDKEIFFHDEALQNRFIQTWKEIAARYGSDSDMVAFELLNEIVSPDVVEEWNDIIKRVVPEIRSIAPDTYIIFGGVCYNNVTSVPGLIKPFADKLVYTFHCYDPLIFTHQKAYWVKNMTKDFDMAYPDTVEAYQEKSMQFSQELVGAINEHGIKNIGPELFEALFSPATKTATERDVPLYCGEYGVIDQAPLPDTVRWLKDINAAFKKYNIGRALWTYKSKDFGITDPHYAEVKEEMIQLL